MPCLRGKDETHEVHLFVRGLQTENPEGALRSGDYGTDACGSRTAGTAPEVYEQGGQDVYSRADPDGKRA